MNLGIRLIQVAAVYMMIGLVIGLAMSMASNYALSPVHAHMSLLGWATMAITGIILYCADSLQTIANRSSRNTSSFA